MRAVKSVSIDSERRVIITFLDGSTETLYPNCIWCDAEALRDIIKELLEEKADAIVQTINNVTLASFEDGADEAMIRKLLVSIDPIQEGSGNPSPENVRPIVGRTGLSVVRTEKNIVPYSVENSLYVGFSSKVWENGYSNMRVISTSTGFSFSRRLTDYGYDYGCGIIIGKLEEGQTYTLKATRSSIDWVCTIVTLDADAVLSSTKGVSRTTVRTNVNIEQGFTFTARGGNVKYCVGFYSAISTQSSLEVSNIQLEKGQTATEWTPYKGNAYYVNWETEAGEVYGGYVDAVSGKLVVDSAEITSYSGETLPSTWISDRDVYAEGTSPTTGAQVVYKLAEPIEYQIGRQDITTYLGQNNIWVDNGNILELEYVADTKLYIGESQSGTPGSGRQSITKPEIQPISETVKDVTEAEEKETQEETEDERGE